MFGVDLVLGLYLVAEMMLRDVEWFNELEGSLRWAPSKWKLTIGLTPALPISHQVVDGRGIRYFRHEMQPSS